MLNVVFYIILVWSVVSYSNVSFNSRLITSVGEERAEYSLAITRIFAVSVQRSSSSFGCLGKAEFFIVVLP